MVRNTEASRPTDSDLAQGFAKRKCQWMKRCLEKLRPFHDELWKECQTLSKVTTDDDSEQNPSDRSQSLVYGGLAWALNILKDEESAN